MQFCTFNVHNFIHLTYTNFQRLYTILYVGVKSHGAHIYVYVRQMAQFEDFKYPEDKKTLSEGSVLVSEEMKSDQNHPGGWSEEEPFLG